MSTNVTKDPTYHAYLRKWSFEYLISPQSPYKWQANEMTKCLYVVSEKYCRDKRFSQVHLDSANLLLLQSLTEIFEGHLDLSVFFLNVEHVYFIENLRITNSFENKINTNAKVRTLPDQCNKRNMTYGFNIIFDIVYRTFTYTDYPKVDEEKVTPVETSSSLFTSSSSSSSFSSTSPTSSTVFASPPRVGNNHFNNNKTDAEKEWHRKKELEKKEMGKAKWYQTFPKDQVKVMEIYKDYVMGPIPLTTGSVGCHLQSPLLQPGECLLEPFGVFCPNATYRIAPPLRDLITNQDFGNINNKGVSLDYWAEDEAKKHHSTQSITLYFEKMKKVDRAGAVKYDLTLQLPFSRTTLALTSIFWALGWQPLMLLFAVRLAAKKQWKPLYFEILNSVIQNASCTSQEAAFAEIAVVEQKNMQDLKEILIGQAKIKIREQLLPHLGQTDEANNLKAKYLGYLVWKILILGEGAQTKFNDVSQDTKISIEDTEYTVPEWLKLERDADLRIKKLHRDHLANTVSNFIGKLLANLIRQLLSKNIKKIQRHTIATLNRGLPVRLSRIFQNLIKAVGRIQWCISSGRWSASKDTDYRQQVTQAFLMQNHIAQESHYTYHSTSMNSDGRNLAARQLNRSHMYNLCPSETPETKKCGLTGHSAQSQEYALGSRAKELEEAILFYQEEFYFIPEFRWIEIYNEYELEGLDELTEIILTGKPIGYTMYPERFVKYFWKLRRTFTIDMFASISYDCVTNIIQIRTDRGRTLAPFIILSRLHHLLARFPENYRSSTVPPNFIAALSGLSCYAPGFFGPRACMGMAKLYKPIPEDPLLAAEHEVMRAVLSWPQLHSFTIYTLYSLGLIDYLDASERKMTVIAMQEKDFWTRKEMGQKVFTHIALDPQFMFSITTGLAPFLNHNQSPRNTYNSAMAKQKTELFLNQHLQAKTKHESFYPLHPLCHTLSNVYRNGFLSFTNITPFTALCSMFGFSNDDAQNLSWSFTRRGAGMSTVCRLFRSEKKKRNQVFVEKLLKNPIQKLAVA